MKDISIMSACNNGGYQYHARLVTQEYISIMLTAAHLGTLEDISIKLTLEQWKISVASLLTMEDICIMLTLEH